MTNPPSELRKPLTVVIVACLFIIAGVVGVVYHSMEYLEQRRVNLESAWILILRVLSIVCGLFLLRGKNWARWLALAWLLYHVVLSAFHSLSETATHFVLLLVIALLLFTRKANEFFRLSSDNQKQ